MDVSVVLQRTKGGIERARPTHAHPQADGPVKGRRHQEVDFLLIAANLYDHGLARKQRQALAKLEGVACLLFLIVRIQR